MRQWFDAFVKRVDLESLPVEAIVVYRGDRLEAEHRWKPDAPRNIYSHTKSYMSTAVGLAVSDGLLTLEDRPAAFFPEALGDNPSEALGLITLRNLLTMSSGFDSALLMSNERAAGIGAPDFARFVLSHPVQQTPGTKFCYSNGDSYLAGRMVEKRVGRTLQAYLQERLLGPLAIEVDRWETCPMGHTFGASGLWLRIGDMMKLGRLFLQEGRWGDAQLVDPAWIRMATTPHIVTPTDMTNPWSLGYGFQFWQSPYPQSYRADGAYGQITTVLPCAEAVVAIQCTESDRFDAVRTALHEELLSHL